jgi:hypothetical protein
MNELESEEDIQKAAEKLAKDNGLLEDSCPISVT